MNFFVSISEPAVVPVLVGPLSAFLALLPAILLAIGGMIVTFFKPSFIKRSLHFLWAQKFLVIAIGLIIWGGMWSVSALFPSTGTIASIEKSDGIWPVWRGGNTRLGAVQGAEEPSQGNVVWSYIERDVKTFFSSPAVVGNRVYITSARYEYFKNTGAICSVDADSGDEVWSYSEDAYLATFSSPAIFGKYLVVGEGLHLTKNARVICMDIEQSEKQRKGVKLWEYRTKSHVESSPCIYEDRLFLGAGDDGFYCFALEPDKDGKAQVLWHLEGKDFPDCESSPVAYKGKVYFGLGIGGQGICCVDAKTGKLLWRTDTPYPVFGSPSISEGRLFLGIGQGDFINTAEQLALNMRLKLEKAGKSESEIEKAVEDIKPIGEVWCLDADTGKKIWDFKCERTVLGAIAVDGERIYVNSRDKHIYCISTAGKLIKKWNAHEAILTSPAVGKDYIYVVTESARLYGLDKKSLSPVWEVTLDSHTLSSPALARGHIYVGSENKGLLCVGQSASESMEKIWAGSLGGNGKSGWWDGSLIPEKGNYARWNLPKEGPSGNSKNGVLPVNTPIAYLDGAFYVGFNRSDSYGLAKCERMKEINKKPKELWFFKTKNPVYISATADKDKVFVVDGQKGDSNRQIRCINAESGKEKWSFPIAADAYGNFILADNRLLVNNSAEGLVCLNPDSGALLWKAEIANCIGAPVFDSGFFVIAAKSPSRVLALDASTGITLWEKPLTSPPLTGVVVSGNRAWVGLSSGLAGYSLIQSEKDVRIDCEKISGTLASDESRVAAVTESGELIIVDSGSGAEITRIKGVAGAFPPLLTDNSCLFNSKASIKLYDFNSEKTTQWTRLMPSWPGKMVTPMVMVESHIFFATDKKGLICMKPKK